MMTTTIAYAVALFVIGSLCGLASFAVALLRSPSPGASWFSGFIEAGLTYFAARWFFGWMEVPFHWFSYLVCMVAPMFNDGQRLAKWRGTPAYRLEQGHASGLGVGIVAALAYHLLA